MRVIIHSDWDGLVCGILLTEIFKPDYILITEPHNIRDGTIELTKDDVVADLPIPPKEVFMAFDHHSSTTKSKLEGEWFIVDPNAPSCARIIYEEYKKDLPKLKRWEKLVVYCDKVDSGNITLGEYEEKNPYNKIISTLSSFDRELDKFYMKYLIKKVIELKSIEAVSKLDWVGGRYDYKQYSIKKWKDIIGKYAKIDDGILIIDIRNSEEFIPKGNPLELYKMYPNVGVAIQIFNSREGVLVAMSENLFKKGKNKAHLGDIAARYGGGGHRGAAGCKIDPEKADEVIKVIINEIKGVNKK